MLGLRRVIYASVLFVSCFWLHIASAEDESDSQERRINQLVRYMRLTEKIKFIHGNPSGFETFGVPRLKIPSIKMADGPIGVRLDTATAFPAAVVLGSTFDPDLMREMGTAMALETRAKGRDMLLGPCVNIHRAPQGGRNFESFGEDPFLNSRFAEAWVQSVQAKGVIASTKHFAANDQEFERMTIDVRVDERTLHEIHFPAFKAAVKAGTFSVMSSYNRLNGLYTSEHSELLTETLKKKWGFRGFVVSDWLATHSTVNSANAGLDVEMPAGEFWGSGKLEAAVQEGKVRMSVLNDKVRRVLRAMLLSGTLDRSPDDKPDDSVVNSPAHQALARRIATDGIVLLKNESVLPLNLDSRRKIAVIGPNAAVARNNGGGSSRVVGPYDISPLEGLTAQIGKSHNIGFAVGIRNREVEPFANESLRTYSKGQIVPGLTAEYFANSNLEGEPSLTRVEANLNFDWGSDSPDRSIPSNQFSARWTGILKADVTANIEVRVKSDDGVRVYIDDKLVIDKWVDQSATVHSVPLSFVAGRDYALRIEYYDNQGAAEFHFGRSSDPDRENSDIVEAQRLARSSDVALVFVGWNETLEHEGRDRDSLTLPAGQDQLISAVASANPKTIVVINGGGSTLMPWLDQVAGVIQAWYPGQEGGNAIADLLLGNSNFSAKLPLSMYARNEHASSFGNFPGSDGKVEYKEGLFVGYRHLDSRGIEPLFPFGFGLSYSTFAFSDLKVHLENDKIDSLKVIAQVTVKNTGAIRGAEVVQLYVHQDNPKVVRPEQELKGFKKVWLEPGESQLVSLVLDHEAFSHYDITTHDWVTDADTFEIRVGNSSRNLPLKTSVRLKND